MHDSPHPAGRDALPGSVLLIGINYWPEETGNAPYTTLLAEHLAGRGVRVSVLTGMPYYPQWVVRDGYRGRLRMRERHGGVDIRRVRQFVPGRQSAARRALFEGTFLAHALPFIGGERPDLVLGVVPSLSGGVLAALAARRHRVPLGLIFQDLVGRAADQSGIPGGGRVAGASRAVEGWAARQADAIAVVAGGFRSYLEDLGVAPDRIHRVRNWTHIASATRGRDQVRADLGLPPDAVVCLHAGNMGYKQGLDNLIEAARLAARSDPNLLFLLVGDGNQRGHLARLAAGLSNVRFLPPRPEDEFPDVLAAADVLLVNQRPSVLDMSLPGKLTSYLAAGRPVVAAVAPGSETAAELRAAGAGVVVDAGAPVLLLDTIRDLASAPERAACLGERGRAFARAHLTANAALAGYEDVIGGIMAGGAKPPIPAKGRRWTPKGMRNSFSSTGALRRLSAAIGGLVSDAGDE